MAGTNKGTVRERRRKLGGYQTAALRVGLRRDLKSDVWTIMDPVRLDLRNKFYLARNYQKRGGLQRFSHDFVYII